MLQTANVLKSNFTQSIGCHVLAVKCSKNDHLNLEECTRQLTDLSAVNSTLPVVDVQHFNPCYWVPL